MKLTTTCSLPPELTEQQIWEALDGIADESIISHLQKCPYCQTRANALENMQSRLKSRLFRATCPPSLELAEFYARSLPDPQMLTVSAHVRDCPHCTRELAELGEFMGADTMSDESLSGKVQTLVARLVSASPALGALRGESREPIVLEADGITITLDIQKGSNERLSILGQLAADDQEHWTEATVSLRRGEQQESTTTVDDLGTFIIQELRPGSIQLNIRSSAGIELNIPSIDVFI